MQLNPMQQQKFAARMNDELEKMTLSWNNDLKQWYPYAMRCLDVASIPELSVPADKYETIFNTETHGINMNVLMVLANNVERTKPSDVGMTAQQWISVIKLNQVVAGQWKELHAPVYKKIFKEFELMQDMPDKKIIKMD